MYVDYCYWSINFLYPIKDRKETRWKDATMSLSELKEARADGTLHGWYVDSIHNIVWGRIEGDKKKRFQDGTRIHTSTVSELEDGHELHEGMLIHTLNSCYLLGKKFK